MGLFLDGLWIVFPSLALFSANRLEKTRNTPYAIISSRTYVASGFCHSTMTIFLAAAAAALEHDPASSTDNGVFAYHAVIKLDVEKNGRNAPGIVSVILAKIQLDEPTVVFTDKDNKRIDNDDLPTDKLTFDAAFAVTTNRNSLYCHLVINSARTFHQIKVGVWDLLQKYNVWLEKSPGPITKTDLVPMGFWLHVHPGFASTRAFHNELTRNISSHYADSPVVTELNLPSTLTEPDIFFTPAKCNGTYDQHPISSNALCMYGVRTDADRITVLITRVCSFATTVDNKTPLYVPFALKKSHPEIYRQYLAQQNTFLETHRNIAIVGVHPSAMDYGDVDNPDDNVPKSLWETLSAMDGVYRVDPCRRTFDLGKWNISCHSSEHQKITRWIDAHLHARWAAIPLKLPSFSAFPSPTRLSRNRVSSSVASGLTDASPVSHYLKSLAARNVSTKIKTVLRNPWRQTPPVQSVQYKFDKNEYPLPNGQATTARTEVSTTMGDSAITQCSLTTIQNEVANKLSALEHARKVKDADFTSRMNAIDDSIQTIQDELAAIADTVTTKVLHGLQKPDGILFKQDAKIDVIQAQLLKLLPMVQQVLTLSPTSKRSLSDAESDAPKNIRRLDNTSPMDTTVARMS
jgi:hypothetical protein